MTTGAQHPALVGRVGAARGGRRCEPRNALCAVCGSVEVGWPLTTCETCGEAAAQRAMRDAEFDAAFSESANGERAHSLALASPKEVSSSPLIDSPVVDLMKSDIGSRISEEKHSPNSHLKLTSTLTPTLTSTRVPSIERILIAILASVYASEVAAGRIASEGKGERMRFQNMVKQWTTEEQLAHKALKSKARAKGFRSIWGMALRNAKAGSQWFPIKEPYLRQSLGYKDKRCTYDLIEALCELEVLVSHPANDALDRNLYRWALPTNIWEIAAGTYDDEEPLF